MLIKSLIQKTYTFVDNEVELQICGVEPIGVHGETFPQLPYDYKRSNVTCNARDASEARNH